MGGGPGPPEDGLKRWLVLGAQLALTALVTWFIADRVGVSMSHLREMGPEAWTPDVFLLAVSSFLLLLGYLVSAALWGMVVVDLGGPRLPVMESVRLFMVANLGRYLPGKVWQIAGLAMMARRKGIAAGTATGAAVLGQGIALVAATLVGVGALVVAPPETRAWSLPGAGVVLAATGIFLLPPVFRWAMGLWFRVARQEAPATLGSVHGVRWLALYAANWALYAFSFWVLAASFGHRGDVVPVASAFAAAYVLGYLMLFAPAGVGVREGFLVAFLTPFMGAGAATVLAVVARLWTTVVELVPAAIFWVGTMTPSGAHTNGGEHAGE